VIDLDNSMAKFFESHFLITINHISLSYKNSLSGAKYRYKAGISKLHHKR